VLLGILREVRGLTDVAAPVSSWQCDPGSLLEALRSGCPWLLLWCSQLSFMRGLFEQVGYLLVGYLGEVFVPQADSVQALWPEDADHFVHLRCQLLTRGGRGNGNGNNDPGRLSLSHRGDSGTHGGSGRHPIIDKEDGAAMYLTSGTVPTVEALASLYLVLLVRSILFRRYPTAVVYAVPAVPVGNGRQPGPIEPELPLE